ncbi:hypothetical protein ACNOYE_12130 [Nannocystaceae bacterium ST9]
MNTKLSTPLVIVLLSACSTDPGLLEGGLDEVDGTGSESGSSSDSGSGSSSDSGSDSGSSSDPDSAESETASTDPCAACEPDELCVGDVDTDLCAADFGFTISCIPTPDTCAGDLCDPACVESLCGAGHGCVPECSGDPVDLWCGDGFTSDACDPMLQDCVEGEKCVPIATGGSSWDANVCVPVLGDDQPGDPCVLTGDWLDECGPASFCFTNPGQAGVCQPLCGPEASCDAGTACLIANEGVLPLCLPTCDPELCPLGQDCVFAEADEEVCVFGAEPAQGLACDQLAQCPLGFACLDAGALPDCEAGACCTSYCELDDPLACEGLDPLGCVAFYEQGMAPEGFENVGVCVLP